MTYKALALDSEAWLRKDVQEAADLELSNFGSPEQFLNSMRTRTPDIVLLHFPLPIGPAHELINMLRTMSIPLILIIESNFPEDEALCDPLVDFVRSPINAFELKARVHKLHSFWASQSSPKRTTQQSASRVNLLFAPELRNEESGRLDASAIADFFGLSLNELARVCLDDRIPLCIKRRIQSDYKKACILTSVLFQLPNTFLAMRTRHIRSRNGSIVKPSR
jgi:DNA-binding response OmpR family regulator